MRVLGGLAVVGLLACSGGPAKPTGCNDATCAAGTPCKVSRDCAIDAGFTCASGVCSHGCGVGRQCPGDQVCADVKGRPLCFAVCVDGKCPSGAPCQTDWTTRKQVCSAVPFAGACKSVDNDAGCFTSSTQYFTSLCDNGYVCPSNAVCDNLSGPIGTCICAEGLTTTGKNGLACIDPSGIQTCLPPDYYCKPIGLPTSTCPTEPMSGFGSCHCSDGRTLPFVCGETNSCDHRCSIGCSLVTQDCPDAWAPRCTIALSGGAITSNGLQEPDRVQCAARLGTRQLAAACSLVPFADGGTQLGRDDCDKGLICDTRGLPRGEARCRRLCTGREDCAASETCVRVGLTFPPSGLCLPAGCTFGGVDCPPGQSCVPITNVEETAAAYCKFDGPAAVGDSCADAGCVSGAVCRGGRCIATCSGQKPCVFDGGTCFPLGYPDDIPGYCL